MLSASDGITVGLWLGCLEEVALGLLLAEGELLQLLLGLMDGD